MPGLTDKAREGEWLHVYNDDGAVATVPTGGYFWIGQVLAVEHDDPDPGKCRYRVWGPGGEQSSVVPGACLERRSRPHPSSPPPGPPPLDAILTAADLRAGLNAALRGDPDGGERAGIVAAVRALVPLWEERIAAGTLTVRHVADHLLRVERAIGACAGIFVATFASRPRQKGPTDAEAP